MTSTVMVQPYINGDVARSSRSVASGIYFYLFATDTEMHGLTQKGFQKSPSFLPRKAILIISFAGEKDKQGGDSN